MIVSEEGQLLFLLGCFTLVNRRLDNCSWDARWEVEVGPFSLSLRVSFRACGCLFSLFVSAVGLELEVILVLFPTVEVEVEGVVVVAKACTRLSSISYLSKGGRRL